MMSKINLLVHQHFGRPINILVQWRTGFILGLASLGLLGPWRVMLEFDGNLPKPVSIN